jgi:hypothetical protein
MNTAFPLEIASILLGLLWLFAVTTPYTLDGYIRMLLRNQFEEEIRRERKQAFRRFLHINL